MTTPLTMTRCFWWLQFGTNRHGKYDIRLIILCLDRLAPAKACKSYVKLLQIIWVWYVRYISICTVSKRETKHEVIKSSHQFPVFSDVFIPTSAIWTDPRRLSSQTNVPKVPDCDRYVSAPLVEPESLGSEPPPQNPWKFQVLRLMDKILHHQSWWLSHDLWGFNHPRWCRISSINSMLVFRGWVETICL